MSRTLTINLGANKERTAWLAKLRRLRATGATDVDIQSLIEWGLGRSARYTKRPGTLKGRTRKTK